MEEQWQLYNDEAKPLVGKGATRDDVFGKGLLHGASHVWIWRNTKSGPEVLLQRRSANKRTWPNLLDISAAGHIDLGETEEAAAVRETVEEIGLNVKSSELKPFGKHRTHMVAESGAIEEEFRWLYLYELRDDKPLKLQESEVSAIEWIPLNQFIRTVIPNDGRYVPQDDDYYQMVIKALEDVSGSTPQS